MWPDLSERDRFGNFAEDDDPEPEPLTCDRCGAVHGDWDHWCEECGAPVGLYGRLKAEGQLEAYLAERTPDPENAPF